MIQEKLYLVQENALPKVLKKTAQAKELLKSGRAKTVNEAIETVGISRSAFYKYRDAIFPFREASREKILTIALILEHIPGVLSAVLNAIAQAGGSILTINQGYPRGGQCHNFFETGRLLLMPMSQRPFAPWIGAETGNFAH